MRNERVKIWMINILIMGLLKIDDQEFDTDNLSEDAKKTLASQYAKTKYVD